MEHKRTDPPTKRLYCFACGELLAYRIYDTKYSTNTGEKFHHWEYWCPKNVWWKVWERHSDFKCDEYGSTYGYEA